MDWRKLILAVCLGSLSTLLSASAPVASSQPSKTYLKAQSITVKVLSADFLGSGFLLRQQGGFYTVLTNAHVLQASAPPYRVQTPDGNVYAAYVPKGANFEKNDLALLQFQNKGITYATASLSSAVAVGDEVLAAGFPATEDGTGDKGLAFTTGKISLLLPKPLEGGYQLGYTSNLEKGMSGGPLLNRRGEVVGVNGMQAYPLWDAPSVFQDRSEANERLHKMIIRLSWAVPVAKVVQMTAKPRKTPDSPGLNHTD